MIPRPSKATTASGSAASSAACGTEGGGGPFIRGRPLFDEALAHPFGDCRAAISDTELLVQLLGMALDGRGAHGKLARDLRSRQALGHAREDLLLARGEQRALLAGADADLARHDGLQL